MLCWGASNEVVFGLKQFERRWPERSASLSGTCSPDGWTLSAGFLVVLFLFGWFQGNETRLSPHYALWSCDDAAMIHHVTQKCWAGNNFMRFIWGGWDWCGDKWMRSRHEDPFGQLAVDVSGSDSSWSLKYSQPELLRVTLNGSSINKHTETNGLIFSSGTLSDSPDRSGNCFSCPSYL